MRVSVCHNQDGVATPARPVRLNVLGLRKIGSFVGSKEELPLLPSSPACSVCSEGSR